MAALVLTVRVHEAALRESGDGGDAAGENMVNVALIWPRPGKAEVLGSTGVVRLRDRPRKRDEPDRPDAFSVLVLKEKVDGDVALLVHVLDRDRRGNYARFLRALAAATVGGAGGLFAGAVPGLVRLAFTEAAEQGAILVGGDRSKADRLEVVAVAKAPLVLRETAIRKLAEKREDKLVRVPLIAPRDLKRPREKGRLAPGRANGHLVLELSASGG